MAVRPFHTVRVGTRPDRLLFAELVGFPCARKASLLKASLEIGVDNTTPRHQIRFPQVVSIETRGVMDVYDIQTESGNYLSNHLVVHNCFINSVEDTMESILTLAKTEGMLFKYGSGTGTNLSPIRSATESARRRRHRERTGLLHEGVRRVRRRHQERWHHPSRREDGHPQRRPSRRRGLHHLQGERGAQGVDAHRGRLRQLVHRRGVRVGLLPEQQQLRPRDRRVHARCAGRPRLAPARRHRLQPHPQDGQGARADAAHRRVPRGSAAIPACSTTRPSTTGTRPR